MNEAAADALRALLTCKHDLLPLKAAVCPYCGAVEHPGGKGWARPALLEALSTALAQSLGERQPTCTQEGCATPAIVTFVWPGRPRAGACSEHALKVLAIAKALGLPEVSLDMKLAGPDA
jgi:hypothetical protein